MGKIMFLGMLVLALFLLGCGKDSLTGNIVSTVEPAKEVAPAEVKVMEVAKEVSPAPIGKEIISYGTTGFNQKEVMVGAGEKFYLVNRNLQKKTVTITFQESGTRNFVNSKLLKFGERQEISFKKKGTYAFWTEGYTEKSKLIVR